MHRFKAFRGHPDDIDHVGPDLIVDVVAQTHVAKVFDEDAPLHVVGVELADPGKLVEGKSGEIRRDRLVSGDVGLLRDGLGHRAVENRIHGRNTTVRNLHHGAVEGAFGPEDGAHRPRGVRGHRKGLFQGLVNATFVWQARDPGDRDLSRLRAVDLLRVRAVIERSGRRDVDRQGISRSDCHVRVSSQGDGVGAGANDPGDRLPQEGRPHHQCERARGHRDASTVRR